VTGIEDIIRTLLPLGKTADPLILPQGVKTIPPPGQELVSIALMAYVPYQFVLREIEDIVKGNRQLYHPQIGREMPSISRNRGDDLLPYFVAEPLELLQS
jgi:hypothetical protein